MHTATILALASLLIAPVSGETVVRAPALTLNGNYAVDVAADAPILSADFTLDSGEAAHVQDWNQTTATFKLEGFADGLRTWRLDVATLNESRHFEGNFTALNVAALLRTELQGITGLTNQTLATVESSAQALAAIHVPGDLARQSDLARLLSRDDLGLILGQVQERDQEQAKAIAQAQQSLADLHNAGNHLAILMLVGLGLLILYLRRASSELRLNPEDRALVRALAQRSHITSTEFQTALHSMGYESTARTAMRKAGVKPRAR